MSGAGAAVPRPPRGGRPPHPLALLATGALLLAVLVATVVSRPRPGDGLEAWHGRPASVWVDLRFEDLPGGGVAVRRAEDGAEVAVLAPGEGGFVRATLRGLARDRKRGDLGPEQPFRLSAWTEGGLSLEDRATGRTLDLRAFGSTQVEAFSRLLPASGEDKR